MSRLCGVLTIEPRESGWAVMFQVGDRPKITLAIRPQKSDAEQLRVDLLAEFDARGMASMIEDAVFGGRSGT